jgi:uncharacterized protein (TIGR03086 family)
MAEVADRFRLASETFTGVVEAVPAGAWSNPSPCPGWTARAVVDHLVGAVRSFFERAGHPLPPGPTADEDPVAAWAATRDAAQAGLDDPAVAALEYEGIGGKTTLEATMDQFLVGDVLIHSWDLATAAGLEVDLDDDLLVRYEAGMRQLGDMPRSNGVFGAEITAPDGADTQTRVLAFTGRKAF